MKKLRSAAVITVLSLFLAGGIVTAGCAAGEKTGKPQVCGGIAGVECPDGYFCEFPAGQCDSADLQGVCLEQPMMCTRDYRPVCGCDGKTYGNDCDRMSKGVQKDHDGECVAE